MYIPKLKTMLVRDGSIRSKSISADNPQKVADLFRKFVGDSNKEHFVVVLMDSLSNAIGINIVSIGTLTASLVHPRETFLPAILASAAAVIVVHNHPSGNSEPSPDDRDATRRLVQSGKLLGIPVLDHVIVYSDTGHVSFRERGLM